MFQGFEVYSKVFAAPTPSATPKPAVATSQSVAHPTPSSTASTTATNPVPPSIAPIENHSPVNPVVPPPAPQEPSVEVDLDKIISELKDMYIKEHGDGPTNEMIALWRKDIASADLSLPAPTPEHVSNSIPEPEEVENGWVRL